jgi:tRNA(fMet)-specific endonuclease VapC
VKYLLDTNTCIRYINGRAPNIRTKMQTVKRSDIVVSSVVKAEMFYGAAKSRMPQQSLAKQVEFFSAFTSLPFDDRAASYYGEIRANLEKLGTPIGPYDLQIAATALAHNLILITHNTSEFSRIPNLNLEDWEQ